MELNVLVVDDSSVMRAMIIKTLKLCGMPIGNIYQAANGQEGLQALGENWVDLALVDINMPVMNGEEMIEKVREKEETRDLAIIVISTEGSESRIESLRKREIIFVHKPFTPEVLREAIINITGVSYEEEIGGGSSTGGAPDF